MYLTTIDDKTGFVRIDIEEDGVLAIKEFKNVIDTPDLGIEAFTCVALVVDYKSLLRHYSDKDRPRAAMEQVVGDRDKFVWKQELIQIALKKYDELQYDPVIEEGRIHYQRKINKLQEFKYSEENYGKNLKDDKGEPIAVKNPSTISAELRKINEDIAFYEKSIQGKDVHQGAPTINGYTLSRLEQKLEKKKSFYNERR